MSDTIDYKGYIITLTQDEHSEGSREYDNLGTMACWHDRYTLGDLDHGVDVNPSDFDSLEEFEKAFEKEVGFVISLSLYLYDHSGITMNTTGFSCPWDSGQVGIIFVSKEKARKEYGWKRITKARRVKLCKYLKGEVEVYDQFLTGDVWYGEVKKGEEDIDSCGGLYGGEYALQFCKDIIDGMGKK